jgi:hypothetical protein
LRGRGVGLGEGSEGGRGGGGQVWCLGENRRRRLKAGSMLAETGTVGVGARDGEHGRCISAAECLPCSFCRSLMLDAWSWRRLLRIAGIAAFRTGS